MEGNFKLYKAFELKLTGWTRVKLFNFQLEANFNTFVMFVTCKLEKF